MSKKILAIDPENITALMEQANRDYTIFKSALAAMGNPPPEKYPYYPALYADYQRLQSSQQRVSETGFQEMPKEAYENWLQSLEKEKRQEENRREQENMKQEMNRLKKLKSTVIKEKND